LHRRQSYEAWGRDPQILEWMGRGDSLGQKRTDFCVLLPLAMS